MEKIDLKCLIQTVVVTRELETLKSKIEDKKVVTNVHLHPFRKFCCHKDSQVAKLACDVIVNFVIQNKLSITEAITWFISSLQSTESINVTIMTIKDLLLLSLHSQNRKSVPCPFGLISPQHPFILILKEDNVHWPVIDCQIQYMFQTGTSKAVFLLLSPFFKYVLWSPPGMVDHGCKRSSWKLLVNNFSSDFSDFIAKTMCWLRTDDENSVLNASFYLTDLNNLEINVDTREKANFICVLSAEIACSGAKLCQNPSFALAYAKEMLKKYPETTDLVLILIAESLPSCPIAFIPDLLRTCIEMININGISNMIVIWMIIGAILPWAVHSVGSTKDIAVQAKSLFDIVEGKISVPSRKPSVEHLQNDSWFMECITSSTESLWAFVIARAIETPYLKFLIKDLSNFAVTSDVVKENFIVNLFVTGVFLSTDDFRLTALEILVKQNAGFQLPLILFELPRTFDPRVQLELVHSLPLTAVVKENIPPVLATIRSFSSSGKPVLVQLSYTLYLTLWKTEERCYQFLHDKLIDCTKELYGPSDDYHMDIVVASAIRDICILKPHIHGKEWVNALADIISRYPNKRDYLPLIIALEAVIKMCKEKIINVFGVYEEFEKKQLLVDERVEVIKQLCDMIGFMFQVAKELMIECHRPLSVIWRILVKSTNIEVHEAALSALSKYNFEEMPLSIVPDQYKKNLKIPRKLVKKTPVLVDEEETLSFIPGTLWLDYLRAAPEELQPKICELLTQWLVLEVNNFSRSLFHSVHRERDSVISFHDKSIFKAIVKNCKDVARKIEPDFVDLKMVMFCLEILNGQRTKSLPPFNWSFLNEFFKYGNEELRKLVLKFWAKESVTSASAKNCIETWLKKIDDRACDKDEFRMSLEIVSSFCVGVASETVASFLSDAIQCVLEKYGYEEYEEHEEHERNVYKSTCLFLRQALKHSEIDEHNCEAICKNLVKLWENADIQSVYFDVLIDAVREMPSTYVDYLSSLSLSAQVSTEDLYKILKLRSTIALHETNNPFLWLNDCIEATSRRLQDKILFFERTLDVFTEHRFSQHKWSWLLQFLDRIQVSADVVSDEVCYFMCDVFIFCVVNTSTYHPFLRDATSVDECYEYFPQALRNIMTDDVSSQMIEWLVHSCKMKKISDRHKQLFARGIIASRNNKYLQKLSVWSNVVQKL